MVSVGYNLLSLPALLLNPLGISHPRSHFRKIHEAERHLEELEKFRQDMRLELRWENREQHAIRDHILVTQALLRSLKGGIR